MRLKGEKTKYDGTGIKVECEKVAESWRINVNLLSEELGIPLQNSAITAIPNQQYQKTKCKIHPFPTQNICNVEVKEEERSIGFLDVDTAPKSTTDNPIRRRNNRNHNTRSSPAADWGKFDAVKITKRKRKLDLTKSDYTDKKSILYEIKKYYTKRYD